MADNGPRKAGSENIISQSFKKLFQFEKLSLNSRSAEARCH